MTKNQIEYAKALETRRANLSQEELTRKRDTAAREAMLVQLGETERHNRAQEGFQYASLDETRRHNVSSEALEAKRVSLDTAKLAETSRHNRATESVASGTLSETKRSNRAREGETFRSNLAREYETARSNFARERETNRSNLAREQETNRANVAREKETKRHNIVSEATDAGSLAERVRHDIAMEGKDFSTKVSLSPSQVVTNPKVNTPSPNYSLPKLVDLNPFKYIGKDSTNNKSSEPYGRRETEYKIGPVEWRKEVDTKGNSDTTYKIKLFPF